MLRSANRNNAKFSTGDREIIQYVNAQIDKVRNDFVAVINQDRAMLGRANAEILRLEDRLNRSFTHRVVTVATKVWAFLNRPVLTRGAR